MNLVNSIFSRNSGTSRYGQVKIAIFGLATLLVAASPVQIANAETRVETVIGTVTSSSAIKNSYIRKTPKDERV